MSDGGRSWESTRLCLAFEGWNSAERFLSDTSVGFSLAGALYPAERLHPAEIRRVQRSPSFQVLQR